MSDMIRLVSSGLVHAPGVVGYARELKPQKAREILGCWDNLPEWAIKKLLRGEYSIDDDDAVVVMKGEGDDEASQRATPGNPAE